MKTSLPKVNEIEHEWFLIDASNKVLGRLSTQIAELLSGKHKPTYTPFFDMGDFVVVINAKKIKLTGNKTENKTYKKYSGYPSGLKISSYEKFTENDSTKVLYHAVNGMLPKNKLRKNMLKRLKIYEGNNHNHKAQSPKPIS
ncbi:MAG: 50S ribosomal protein L13 [Candidatus Cloacimonetes bacterium]|nr:50S ribosomal protein L13 [Candidatus Cloacimonadota bacterium]MBL7107684.1 50S ribosomal protein L13 [Candidatus Cloacimonadota bacterium]